MGRINPLSSSEVEPEAREIFDEIEKAFGMVPNLFRTYAHFPPLLRANWEKTKTLMMGGSLPRSLKEMIAIAVSQANTCQYCVAAHGMMLQQLGFSEETVRNLEEGIDPDNLSERDRDILAFVRKSTSNPLSVTNRDVELLREEHSLSNAEIVEVQGVMELFTGYNRFIDSLSVDLDF